MLEEIRQIRNQILGEDYRSPHTGVVRKGVVVAVKELPPSLRAALKSVGFRRSDITVTPVETIQMSGAYGKGYRAFIVLVNLATGKHDVKYGSWGGANMFTQSAVDTDRKEYPIPPNGAAIKGQEGGGRPTMASIYVNPQAIAAMLPATEKLTDEEKRFLDMWEGLTSAGRKYEFERMMQDAYFSVKPGFSPEGRKEALRAEQEKKREIEAMIDSLVKRGLLARNKAGATKITTKGRNALRG